MTVEKRAKREQGGTFAQLYDAQEELSRRNAKPLGRPKKKVARKPTTIHLTPAETRSLGKLHLLINDRFSVNRSELVGVAIDALVTLVEQKGLKPLENSDIQDVDDFRRLIFDFIKL
jgi:hypothetical protein